MSVVMLIIIIMGAMHSVLIQREVIMTAIVLSGIMMIV